MFKRISASDAHNLLAGGTAQLVDIRDELSYQTAHIKGALNLNNTNLQNFIESADPVRCWCVAITASAASRRQNF